MVLKKRESNFLKKYYNSILTKGHLIIAISKHIEDSIKKVIKLNSKDEIKVLAFNKRENNNYGKLIIKNNIVEIQGDHRVKVREYLKQKGYPVL